MVQGLTEFLPISSSGHLAILQHALGWSDPEANLAFTIAVHLGSLGAVLVFVRREIVSMLTRRPRLLAVLIVATLPMAAGVLLVKLVSDLSADLAIVGLFLLATAGILALAKRLSDGQRTAAGLPYSRALMIGVAQICAVLPGISRSGSTLVAGLGVGLEREQAVRFSFLMAAPAIAGAGFYMLLKGGFSGEVDLAPLAAGAVTSFLASLFAMKIMVGVVLRRRLGWFGLYCAAVGLFAFVWGVAA